MPLRSTKDYSVGILYFILFILTIPAMNWVVTNVGTVCTADGPLLNSGMARNHGPERRAHGRGSAGAS